MKKYNVRKTTGGYIIESRTINGFDGWEVIAKCDSIPKVFRKLGKLENAARYAVFGYQCTGKNEARNVLKRMF